MKKYSYLIILGWLFVSFSCSEASDSEPDTSFDLNVTSAFEIDVDFHIQPVGGAVENYGTISFEETRTVTDLQLSVDHIVTVTEVSAQPDNWYAQFTINNPTADTTLVLAPQF